MPERHWVHAPGAIADTNMPARQSTQYANPLPAGPTATDLPLGQAVQAVAPAGANMPTAQFTHEPPIAVDAYLPATQAVDG